MLGKGGEIFIRRENMFSRMGVILSRKGRVKQQRCHGGLDPPSSNKSVSIAATGFRVKPGMTR